MSGKLLRGHEAAAMGLVNHAYPKEEVLGRAYEMAAELSSNPVWAVNWTKLSINKMIKQQLNLILETSIAYESMTMMTHDYKEAASSYAEKRKPVFQGF